MKRFAELVDRLQQTADPNIESRLLTAYFRGVPDPDRGLALAALRGEWPSQHGGQRLARELVAKLVPAVIDPELYKLSRAASGDTAETLALLWPDTSADGAGPTLRDVEAVLALPMGKAAGLFAQLDRLDATARKLLIRFAIGSAKRLASPRGLKGGLAALGPRTVAALDDIWPSVRPPYPGLFAWLEGKSEFNLGPASDRPRPPPVYATLILDDAWPIPGDGVIGQWLATGFDVAVFTVKSDRHLITREGDDVAKEHPSLLEALPGGLIADGQIASDRKRLARLRLFDPSKLRGQSITHLPFQDRIARLRAELAEFPSELVELAMPFPVARHGDLRKNLEAPPNAGLTGLLLRSLDGLERPVGIVARPRHSELFVLMYAERAMEGQVLLTLGVFPDGNAANLVPVGKALAVLDPAEAENLKEFVAANRTERFGPVTAVPPVLVVEATFAGIEAAPRRKAGVALLDPQITALAFNLPVTAALRLPELVEKHGHFK